MEQEAEQLKRGLRGCKSKEEAQRLYLNAKTQAMGGTGKGDGSFLFLSAVLDRTYKQHKMEGGTSKLNIWA